MIFVAVKIIKRCSVGLFIKVEKTIFLLFGRIEKKNGLSN